MHRPPGAFNLQLLARHGDPKRHWTGNDDADDPNRRVVLIARTAWNVGLGFARNCLGSGSLRTRRTTQGAQKMAALPALLADPLRRDNPLSSAGLRWLQLRK
jgi:hypothetical protein